MTVLHAELYDALLSADVPEEKARAAARSFLPGGEVASKLDLSKLESRLDQMESRLLRRLGGLIIGTVGIVTSIATSLLIAYLA